MLYQQVLTLELPPGSRLSEVEVAKILGVSRQPVRDAFWRLSQLGFLEIRPQRSTTVTQISERAVAQARFIRTALEVETVRVAAKSFGADDFALLDAHLAEQAQAVSADDRKGFLDAMLASRASGNVWNWEGRIRVPAWRGMTEMMSSS